MAVTVVKYLKCSLIAHTIVWQIIQLVILFDTGSQFNKNINDIRVTATSKDYDPSCILINEKKQNNETETVCSNKLFVIPERIHAHRIISSSTHFLIPTISKLNKQLSFNTNPRSPPSKQFQIG